MVPKSSAIAQVMGVTNAVTIDADAVRELTLIGPGAGGEATASAVVADIAEWRARQRTPAFGRPVGRLERAARAPMQRHEGGYYIRLTVPRPARRRRRRRHPDGRGRDLAREHRAAPLRSRGAQDPHGRSGAPVPVVLITYAATEEAAHPLGPRKDRARTASSPSRPR